MASVFMNDRAICNESLSQLLVNDRQDGCGESTAPTAASISIPTLPASSSSVLPSLIASPWNTVYSQNPTFLSDVLKISICFIVMAPINYIGIVLEENLLETVISSRHFALQQEFNGAMDILNFTKSLVVVVVTAIVIRWKHGKVFGSTTVPIWMHFPYPVTSALAVASLSRMLRSTSFRSVRLVTSSIFIPTMFVGACLLGVSYDRRQLLEATLLSVGMELFFWCSRNTDFDSNVYLKALPGAMFFAFGYIFLYAIHLHWQSFVYHKYGKDNIDIFQMVLGINLAGLLLTTGKLILWTPPAEILDILSLPGTAGSIILASLLNIGWSLLLIFILREYGALVYVTMSFFEEMIFHVYARNIVPAGSLFGATMAILFVQSQCYRAYTTPSHTYESLEATMSKADETEMVASTTQSGDVDSVVS